MRTVVRTNGPIFIQVIGSSALTTIWNVRTLVRNILQQNRVMVTITKIHLYPVVLVLQTVFLFSSDFFRQILHFQWHTRSTATTFLLLEKGRAKATKKAYECHITSSSWWIQSCWASSPWDYFRVGGRWLGNLTPQNSCVILQDWFSLDSYGKVIGQNCKKKNTYL